MHFRIFILPLFTKDLMLVILNLSLQNPVDPGEACPGPSGDITHYQIRFQTGSFVDTENVNITACRDGRCSCTFNPLSSSVHLSFESVSVAAENVIGVGAARTCTAQPISELHYRNLSKIHPWVMNLRGS